MLRSFIMSAILIVGSGLFVANMATAEPAKDAPTTGPSTQPANKMCAVMQEDAVDPKVTVVYKGKTIGFCCKDCVPEFQKDPEKYVKNMK